MGLQMFVPAAKGEMSLIFSKESNRKLVYAHYSESIKFKNFALFGGAGIHAGACQTLRFKQDAETIFLAGVTAIGGIRYSYKKIMLQADMLPRTDLPLFGGCMEHRYCSESDMNFSLSLNIKL